MKATGIVRRIDDLGRVVIPKEIRRTGASPRGQPATDNVDSLAGNLPFSARSVKSDGDKLYIMHNRNRLTVRISNGFTVISFGKV